MSTFVDLHRSDFNFLGGSSFADILWRDQAGDNVLWIMANQVPVAGGIVTLPFVPPDWHFKAAADFDLSPAADILWQNDNGSLALWQMNGATATPTVNAIRVLPNPGPTWHVVGDNDFDGIPTDDILFQHDSGALAIWTFAPGSGAISGMLAGTQNPGPTWHVVGTGDTNNDGKAGILWQHDSGALALWENPILTPTSFSFTTVAPLPTLDPSWHVKGMADLNGDQRSDIVFQNDSGAVAVWEMAPGGTTIAAINLVNSNLGPAFHIAGLRDMNGDGRADILLQDNNNTPAAVWENYVSLGGGRAAFGFEGGIFPNPNPNGHVWDLL